MFLCPDNLLMPHPASLVLRVLLFHSEFSSLLHSLTDKDLICIHTNTLVMYMMCLRRHGVNMHQHISCLFFQTATGTHAEIFPLLLLRILLKWVRLFCDHLVKKGVLTSEAPLL